MRAISQIFGASLFALFLSNGSLVAQATDDLVRVFQTIEVTGNDRFRDQDILATADLRPGEPYTEDDILAAVEALEFTGEFRSIRIFSQGDVLTIAVDEEPEFSGALTFGLGYDTDNGAFGTVGVELADIWGGLDLDAGLRLSEQVILGTVDLSGDAFWPGDRSGGVRGGFALFDYDDTLFDFRTGNISPYVTFGNSDTGFDGEVRITALWTDISSVDPDASPIVQAEAGDRFVAGPGVSLRWQDTEQARWAVGVNVDVYGGDTQFVDASLGFTLNIPLMASTKLRSSGRIGAITGLSDGTTTVADRRTLGGASMRGFARGGLTPVDFCAGCGAGGEDVITDLGGERYAVLQNDLLFTGLAERLPFTPGLYFDIGSVWDVDSPTAPAGTLFDEQVWRTSFGLALTSETPLGNFSASYAIETDAEDFDDTERFGLAFSTRF